MPGRFDHLHTMLAAGLVRRLGSPDGVLDLAAVRSTSGGTLAAKLQEFGEATAAYDVERLSGRVPSACFFKGDDNDVSKLSALKAVTEHIKLLGSMEFNAAAVFVSAQRTLFFANLNAALADEGFSKVFKVPDWSVKRAGNEILARLPIVRVPTTVFGQANGANVQILLPIIPVISDADLLMHIELVKDLREAHAAAARPGDDFDAAEFRLPQRLRVARLELHDGVDERVAEDRVVDEADSERRHSLVRLEVLDEGRVGEAAAQRHRKAGGGSACEPFGSMRARRGKEATIFGLKHAQLPVLYKV